MPKRSNSNQDPAAGLSSVYLIEILRFKLEICKKKGRHSRLNGELITYMTSKFPELSVTDVHSWIFKYPWITDPKKSPPATIWRHDKEGDETAAGASSASAPQRKRTRRQAQSNEEALTTIKIKRIPKARSIPRQNDSRLPTTNAGTPRPTIPETVTKIRKSPRFDSTPSSNVNMVNVQEDPTNDGNDSTIIECPNQMVVSSSENPPPVPPSTPVSEINDLVVAAPVPAVQLDEDEEEQTVPASKQKEQSEPEQRNVESVESEHPISDEEGNLPLGLQLRKALETINKDSEENNTSGGISNVPVQPQLPALMNMTPYPNYTLNWTNTLAPGPAAVQFPGMMYQPQPPYPSCPEMNMFHPYLQPPSQFCDNVNQLNGNESDSQTSKSSNSSYPFSSEASGTGTSQENGLELQKRRLQNLFYKFEDLLHARYNLRECEISGAANAWQNWNNIFGMYQGYMEEMKAIIFSPRSD